MNFQRRIEAAFFFANGGFASRGGLFHPPSLLNSAGKALMVVDIDYQDGWHPHKILRDETMKTVSQALVGRLAQARRASIPIMFVMLDPLRSNHINGAQTDRTDRREKCLGCDREDNKLPDFLGHRHGNLFEAVFVKGSADAFTNPSIASFLRMKRITQIFLAGCNTFACIQATAIGAVKAGFDVSLVEDCAFPPFQYESYRREWLSSIGRACPETNKAPSVVICQGIS